MQESPDSYGASYAAVPCRNTRGLYYAVGSGWRGAGPGAQVGRGEVARWKRAAEAAEPGL